MKFIRLLVNVMDLKSYIKDKLFKSVLLKSNEEIMLAIDMAKEQDGEIWYSLFGKELYLKKNIIELLNIVERYIKNFFLAESVSTSHFSHKLVIEINKVEFADAPIFVWLVLYQILIIMGLFVPAYYIRKNIVQSSILEASNSVHYSKLSMGVKAAYEIMDLEELKKLFNKSVYWRWCNKLLYHCVYSDVFKGKKYRYDIYKKYNNSKYGEVNKLFSDFIFNKSIAIVGPGYTEEKMGSEIDSFDVVVRASYFGNISKAREDVYGIRTDVSYYNYNKTKKLLRDYQACLEELSFACFKSGDPADFYGYRNTRPFRIIPSALIGDYNLIPTVVNDVLSHYPKHLKLFAVDFYTGDKPYHSKYNDTAYNYDVNYREMFSQHDPITQIEYIRKLNRLGEIEVDDLTHNALSKSII